MATLTTVGGGAENAKPAAPVLPPSKDANEVKAPIVSGGGGFKLLKPQMYRQGWVDLNKNGRKDRYEDPTEPVEARVEDLLAQMTVAEKIGQLEQKRMDSDSDQKEAALLAGGGLGSFLGAAPDAGLRNRLQRIAVEESRLGVPLIFGFDTIHGFRTTFPTPLALSCAWDPDLVERLQAMAAAESAAAGIDWVFAPKVDIARDPRWGRIAEGFGEDPWLGGLLAAASVRGFQGPDYSKAGRVAACLKHYVGYGAAEGGRDYNTTEIGLPTLRNIYLPPFHAGVVAGAATIMSAFNCLNGVPTSGNHFTLTEVLRDEWRFPGFVVSDWNAVFELIHHGYAGTRDQAAAMALTAGVDMEMVSDCYRTQLPALIERSAPVKAALDEAVRRVLRVKIRKGLFDVPYTGPATLDPMASAALAREAAQRCCVLVKNDRGTLPLQPGFRSVAVIGPLGDDQVDMLGCWSGLGRWDDAITLRKGLGVALKGVKVGFAKGCEIKGGDRTGFDSAVALARSSDVIILAVGEEALMSGEANYRLDLGLPGYQQELFDRIAALHRQLITILFTGRPLAVPAVLAHSAAVLVAWHPGVQAGMGLADLLTGAVAPSGRLTTTFPTTVGQVPNYYNYSRTGRPFDNYKDGSRDPLLRFGFGLTYTEFSYGPTRLSTTTLRASRLTVSATVRNIGARAGTEVVQLYLRPFSCSFGARPMQELKGYQRIHLKPGEQTDVTFALSPGQLGAVTSRGQWVTEAGTYAVTIAPQAGTEDFVSFTLDPNAPGVTAPPLY